MKICGIDPGNNGAMCVLDSSNLGSLALLDFAQNSTYEMANWLHQYQVDVVWIEDVHSIYGMSAKSNFGFGRSVGTVHSIAEILLQGTTPKLVTPKVWQKYIGVAAKGKAIKNEVAQITLSMYPGANIYGSKGGLRDGRADAIMVAHYGLHNP